MALELVEGGKLFDYWYIHEFSEKVSRFYFR